MLARHPGPSFAGLLRCWKHCRFMHGLCLPTTQSAQNSVGVIFEFLILSFILAGIVGNQIIHREVGDPWETPLTRASSFSGIYPPLTSVDHHQPSSISISVGCISHRASVIADILRLFGPDVGKYLSLWTRPTGGSEFCPGNELLVSFKGEATSKLVCSLRWVHPSRFCWSIIHHHKLLLAIIATNTTLGCYRLQDFIINHGWVLDCHHFPFVVFLHHYELSLAMLNQHLQLLIISRH